MNWRLPNVRELHSLVHYAYTNPAVPDTVGTGQGSAGDPFVYLAWQYYWSSSTNAHDTDRGWVVGLHDGYVHGDDLKTAEHYVLPVRGGH